MLQIIKKALHWGTKAYKGNLFDGVSYDKQKENETKGKVLEQEIKNIAEQNKFKVVTNVYLPHRDTYTELDVVLVGYGEVIIVEAKNYTAKIVGNTSEKEWVAEYNNGKSYTLYNPCLQVASQQTKLQRHLSLSVTTLVVFSNNSNLEISGGNKHNVINVKDLEGVLRTTRGSKNKTTMTHVYKEMKKLQTKNPFIKLKQQKNAIKQNKK